MHASIGHCPGSARHELPAVAVAGALALLFVVFCAQSAAAQPSMIAAERLAERVALPAPLRFKLTALYGLAADDAGTLSADQLRARATRTVEWSFLVFPSGDVRRGSPSLERYVDRDGFMGMIGTGARSASFHTMNGIAEIVELPSQEQARESMAQTLPMYIPFAIRAAQQRGEEVTESTGQIRAGEWTWQFGPQDEVTSWTRNQPGAPSTAQVIDRVGVPGIKAQLWSRVFVTMQPSGSAAPTFIVFLYDDYRLDPNADPLDVDWRSQAVKAVDWRTKEPIEFERVGPRTKAAELVPPKPALASTAPDSTPPAERTGPKAIRVGPDGLSDAQRGGLSRWSWLGIAGGSALVLAGIVLTVLRRRG